MAVYKVTYRETLEYEYLVEADNKEEAEKEFYRQANEMEIKFDDGEVIDSETIIEKGEDGNAQMGKLRDDV